MKENTTGQLTPFEMNVCQEYFNNGLNKSEAYRKCIVPLPVGNIPLCGIDLPNFL